MQDEEEEEWEPVDRDHVVKFFQVINQQSHQNIVRELDLTAENAGDR